MTIRIIPKSHTATDVMDRSRESELQFDRAERVEGRVYEAWLVVKLAWKRFFLMVPGAHFVVNGILTLAGVLPHVPIRATEAGTFKVANCGLIVLGAWMFYRGWQMRPPPSN